MNLMQKIQAKIDELNHDANVLSDEGGVNQTVQANKMRYAALVLSELLHGQRTGHVKVVRKQGWMSTLSGEWERGQPVSIVYRGQFRKGWVVGYTQGSTMGMAGTVKVKLSNKDIIANVYETHVAKLQGSVLADFIATHGTLDHDSFGAPDWVGGDPLEDKLRADWAGGDAGRSTTAFDEDTPGVANEEPGGGVEADDPRWAYYRRSLKMPRGHGTHGRIRMRFYYHMRELVECAEGGDTWLTSMLNTYAERYNIDTDDEIMVRRTSPVTD